MNSSRHPAKRRGFTLLEVLVALVVLSIGVIGISALQNVSLRNSHSAMLRSQATTLSLDILDRMRANREGAVGGAYDLNYGGSVTNPGCTSNCSEAQVAQRDLDEWRFLIERLPGGDSAVSVTAAGLAVVQVRWADNRDSAAKLEITTRTSI